MAIVASPDFKGIPDAHAVWLTYELAQETGPNARDTVGVFFGITQLKEFYEGLIRGGYSGMRIYMAKYPTNYPGLDPKYRGKRTLVFVATQKDPLRPEINIDAITEARVYKIINDEIPRLQVGEALYPNDDFDNHGELCPPNNCNGSVIGGGLYNNIP